MKRLSPYLFLLPMLTLVLLFYLIPAASTVFISTTDMGRSLRGHQVGFANFSRMFSLADPVMARVLLNTILYLLGALAITLAGGLFLAVSTTTLSKRRSGALGGVFRVVWFLPRATPPVVWAYLWIWAFDPTRYGLINMVLAAFGAAPQSWMSKFPLIIVILANGILGIPYTMTILSAAIGNIPDEIIEAATMDGASAAQITFAIRIPLIWWPLSFLTIWHSLSFLTTFQYILMITGGGPFYASTPLSLYVYNKAFGNMELGYGSALALVLILLSVAVILVFRRILGTRGELEEAS